MRHLLTLVSLLLVGSVWADDFNFNSPRAKAAMEKYQYDKEDLLRDLEAALEHERTKGSLEEAIKIRDAIATLKQQPDAPVVNAHIPADAVEWNGHYYKGFKQPMTWHAAKDFCNSIGGHLLRIQDARENSFAQKLAIETKTGGWIDGSDEVTNGEWVFSNSEPMKYFNWDSAVGEPSNSNYRMQGNTGIEHHIHSKKTQQKFVFHFAPLFD